MKLIYLIYEWYSVNLMYSMNIIGSNKCDLFNKYHSFIEFIIFSEFRLFSERRSIGCSSVSGWTTAWSSHHGCLPTHITNPLSIHSIPSHQPKVYTWHLDSNLPEPSSRVLANLFPNNTLFSAWFHCSYLIYILTPYVLISHSLYDLIPPAALTCTLH